MFRPAAAAILTAMLCLIAMPDSEGQAKDPVVEAAEARAAAIRAMTRGDSTGGGSPSAAAPAVPAAAGVPFVGPKRRDGYWEMSSHWEDGSLRTTQNLCVGGGSEDKFSIWDQLTIVGDCSRKELARSGAGWSFDVRCEIFGMMYESKGTMGGDFRDRFRVDLTTVNEGRPEAGSIRGVHKGACPAAFKPGDLISDSRVLMNVLD